jgi:hypothetical protein
MAHESFEDVTADLPRFVDQVYNTRGCIQRSDISPSHSRITTPGRRSNPQPNPVHPKGRTPETGQSCTPIHSSALALDAIEPAANAN